MNDLTEHRFYQTGGFFFQLFLDLSKEACQSLMVAQAIPSYFL